MGIWFVYGAVAFLLILVLGLELASRKQAKHQKQPRR
jgi:hypothetical protein